MKVAVVGAGAMGGALAVALELSGHDVHVLDAFPALVERINSDGLRVQTPEGTEVGKPHAALTADEIGAADIVIVFVKSIHTHAVAASIGPLVGPNTTVVSLQNGWGNTDVLAEVVPHAQLAFGVTYNSCSSVGLGEIAHTGRGHTYVGDYVGGAERAEIVAEALSGGRWETTASPTVATEIWKKLILNSVSLPLSSLARLRTEGLVECEPVAELADAVARESCAVARAAGYDIDDDERIAVIRATHLRAGKGKTSMLQDVEALRATEIQVVNGAVVRAADAAGVEAPLNKALAQLVSGLEQGWKAPFGAAN